MALIAKQIWRLISFHSSLFSFSLRAKYLSNGLFNFGNYKGADSWVWKNWSKVGSKMCRFMIFRIGNGRYTKIWDFPWIPNLHHFKPRFNPLWRDKLFLFCELMTRNEAGVNSWNTNLIKEVFHKDEADKICKIHIPVNDVKDQLWWLPNAKGLFSVKFAYSSFLQDFSLTQDTPEGSISAMHRTAKWKCHWKLKTKPKIQMFIWNCLRGAIATGVNLLKRVKIWKLSPVHQCSGAAGTNELLGWWDWISAAKLKSVMRDRVHVCTYILWWIWKSRNLWHFDKLWKSEREVIKLAMEEWMEYEDGAQALSLLDCCARASPFFDLSTYSFVTTTLMRKL